MLALLRTQRSPRVHSLEGDSVRDGHSRPSGVDEACYIQLPRVDEGDAAGQQAIHHTQTGHPKMASASSEHIPLLLDDGQGLMEPQLPDVTDDITKAPRRFEQVPLVGAPAADDWKPTDALRNSIKKAINESDAEGLRKSLAGLSPEQAEKALTTGEWNPFVPSTGSAIHYAIHVKCKDVKVFEVLLHNRRQLLNLKSGYGNSPLQLAAMSGSVGVVEKLVELGGKELLEARDENGETPLHWAALKGNVAVVKWMLKVNPQLLKTKANHEKTPLDRALEPFDSEYETREPKVVAAMLAVAGGVVIELLETDKERLNKMLQPEVFPTAAPFVGRGIGERRRQSDSLAVDSLRWCSTFRGLIKTRQKDSLTERSQPTSAAIPCPRTLNSHFRAERESGLRCFTVVTQANCISLVEHYWQPPRDGEPKIQLSPRDVFITRVLSMLLMVAFVMLHIESIKGDSGVMMTWGWPSVWPSMWLWGAVLTGCGFILLEVFQGIRLKAAYWEDSWNIIDTSGAVSIAVFTAIHFIGWSSEAEVGSAILVALLFALRLLQTASLHPIVGPLILAVMRMFSDISMFLCLYVYILLVFAGVFTVLSSDEDHQDFGSFPKATLTLFYAGQGDFSDALTNAIESHDTLGTILLFTYVILSSIILASTYAAIEETQTAQYQLLRIRVLNEYLTMPRHERLPPPFNLIALVVSVPLRHLASHISGQRRRQSALCCIVYWLMKAVYSTVDALLYSVAFTPVAIYGVLGLLQRQIREGKYRAVLTIIVGILVMPVNLLCAYAQHESLFTSDATETENSWMAHERREARDKIKDSIDKWIEAADHHDSNSPDVMAVVQQIDNRLTEIDRRQDARHTQMEKRLTEMKTYIRARIK
ncbi:unnamed protein product [Vitrella brassicaformis CCMP3155]|uniref:Ion transport domain-containing protein n=1 Tax=Vitrella brassicaformis (strain CCMP3155) TaxID=1169540 RepID=A0A0G4GVZ1_VITBC|nr:unnamed protein product [Vitrella brassicaformis CCMP3155]|eukprot:CEM35125.1 unnamed protein product [Vitrella brassicaformis CCMP3155]